MQQHKKIAVNIRILISVKLINSVAGLLPVHASFLLPRVWQVCGVRFRPPRRKRPALKFSVILRKLLDFDKLICADSQKVLFRIARRPPNLQLGDLRGLAQPNMLLKR
jgi:hypothetical protein